MSLPSAPEPRQMRCADSDRQLVVDVLNSAYAEGRITLDEHDERTSAVWQAKTFAELTQTTADLVPSTPIVPLPASTGRPVGQLVRTDGADPAVDTIWSFMGTTRREGYWRLRRNTKINTVMGDAKIDLRNATLDAPECTINVTTVMGDVKVWVPDGIDVQLRVSSLMGDDKVTGMRPLPANAPRVVITGFSVMGDVKVFGPDHVSLGKRLGLE